MFSFYHFPDSLDISGNILHRIHNKGTDREYTEYYYYILEAKIVLHPDIIVSIMTEFVENTNGEEAEKQDCERNACYRLMGRLKKEFPRLPICFCADSLYACEKIFAICHDSGWHYILRFKEGSIPTVAEEYRSLKKTEKTAGSRPSVTESASMILLRALTIMGIN